MIERELGQTENTLTLNNIILLSAKEGVEVSITMHDRTFEGIVKSVDHVFNEETLYLRRDVENAAGMPDRISEEHSIVRVNAIEGISFITEKGYLDNLVE